MKFFSYVVKESVEGLRALFGRNDLLFEDAVLQGYELCVQTVKDVSGEVLPSSPLKMSPRQIMEENFSADYELYVIRMNPDKNVPGKVWYVSPDEYEYLREWEMIESGMSEDITAKVLTKDGDLITVSTYGLVKNADKISKVVDSTYIREEVPAEKKLQRKREVRLNYIKRINGAH